MASCWKGTAVSNADEERKAAFHGERQLRLFDEIGTLECVNPLTYQGELVYWDELLASDSLELLVGPETGHTEHTEH